MGHVLIVEDDADSAEMLASLVADAGNTVATAGTLRDARRQLALQEPDLVLLDLVLPDGSGIELYDAESLATRFEVVLITGHATLETSIQALRLGAADYLQKPINFAHLQGILSRVMRPAALQAEIAELNSEAEESGRFGLMWGRSPPMKRVYQQISRVAGTSVTVLVTGESGTGKEVAARTTHDLSRRRKQPFLAVNCGAISPHLIESEIFGHEKGSFTGAVRQHEGFFERANGGTLFLDEITEMPLELQVKLLRVLETGVIMRVGSSDVREIDVRVIAATNREPEQAVAAGKLREDLFYRLNVFPIHLPRLGERLEDVPLLAGHFLDAICRSEGEKKSFSEVALTRLMQRRWPGNVRELRNVVHRAYVMAAGPVITDEWLFDPARPDDSGAPRPGATGGLNGSSIGATHPGTRNDSRDADASQDGGTITFRIGTSLADVERALILATMKHYDNHREKTAEALGVSLKTLYNRLKEYADPRDGEGERAS